jgi:4-diphosphocytidyl-2-C-methyl-D-erythritol kinase
MIITGHAYAKINISLDIISKMDNGFHYLKTIMQSINLCDEITIECTSNENKRLTNDISVINSGCSFLPGDERNIAVKAAKAFLDFNDLTGFDIKINIIKNIPVCAGLGGGSADGACVIRILNRMFDTKLNREALINLGNIVGSDVPFCIFGGTVLAEGRGDILTNLTSLPSCFIVVCKPFFSCSTPELFKKVDCKRIKIRPDIDGIVSSLEEKDIGGVVRRMYNVFEGFLPRGIRDIEQIKYIMLDNGALGSIMTGSGPAVFGIFENEKKAQCAFNALKQNYKECYMALPAIY